LARLAFRLLSGVEGLSHLVTERTGGASRGPFASWNLGSGVGDEPEAVAENARLLRAALGAPAPVRFPRQVHGATVLDGDAVPGPGRPEGDAFVVSRPGVAVGVLGADCPGVLLVDPARKTLCVAHSGWRGTVAGVVPAAVAALVARGSDPRGLLAGIGPGIASCAYEVGPEVADAVRRAWPSLAGRALARGREDRWHLDLEAAIRGQLVLAGLPEGSIESTGLCTHRAEERFFSHRRDGPRTGRHALAAVWL
jgi:YfiH family protein